MFRKHRLRREARAVLFSEGHALRQSAYPCTKGRGSDRKEGISHNDDAMRHPRESKRIASLL